MKTTPVPVTRTMMSIPAEHQPRMLVVSPVGTSNALSFANAQEAAQDGYERACCGGEMPDADSSD